MDDCKNCEHIDELIVQMQKLLGVTSIGNG